MTSTTSKRWFATVVTVLLLSSCHTTEVLENAPVEFWTTGEQLVVALVEDVRSVVEWVIGLIL